MDAIQELYLNSGLVKKFLKFDSRRYTDNYFKVSDQLYVKLGPWKKRYIESDEEKSELCPQELGGIFIEDISAFPSMEEAIMIARKAKDIVEVSQIFSNVPLINRRHSIIDFTNWDAIWTNEIINEDRKLRVVYISKDSYSYTSSSMGIARLVMQVRRV